MQSPILSTVVSDIAGSEGVKIVGLLQDKKNVNEFLIAKKLNLTINQTRNLLYKLADHGLVKFVRKKDKKKGGWYTYFWTFDKARSFVLLKEKIMLKVDELNEKTKKRKEERFYYSPDAKLEYTEDEALDHGFICPETGSVLELKDNNSLVQQMEKEISVLKEALDKVNQEIEIIERKGQKNRERKANKEKKKKKEERDQKRAVRAAERVKLKKIEAKSSKAQKKHSGKSINKKSSKKRS